MPSLEYLNGIIETPPPSALYHYTNSSGLMGILSSKKIWTTKLQYLNDSSELELALSYFRQEIMDQQNGESKQTRTAEELKAMLDAIDNLGQVNVGVAAFTKMGDQLSQWRGYCQIGDGYSIAFDGRRLLEVANATKGHHLVRCMYQENEHRNIAKALIREAPVIAITQHPNYGKAPFFDMAFPEAVLFLAPIIKATSFQEEIEWRLISPARPYREAKFRRGNQSVIPYWEFDLDLEHTLMSIIIGPTPEKELSELALTGLIMKEIKNSEKHLKIIGHIRHSSIPFRET